MGKGGGEDLQRKTIFKVGMRGKEGTERVYIKITYLLGDQTSLRIQDWQSKHNGSFSSHAHSFPESRDTEIERD